MNDVQPRLMTPRLVLDPLSERDAAVLHEAFGDTETMRHWDRPVARDEAETLLRICRSLATPRVWTASWIVREADTQGFAGLVAYHHHEPWNDRAELGWMLARRLWGRGLMTEAAGALVRHAFEAMRLHRVEALIEPDNARSVALALRLGFRPEGGPMRARLRVGDTWRDQLMFARLRSD